MSWLAILIQRAARHRLTRNSATLAIVQLVNLAVPFALMLWFTAVLGPERYGVVAFVMGLVQIGGILIDLGFSLSAVREVAAFRGDTRAIARFAGAVYFSKLVVFALVGLGFGVYASTTEEYGAYAAIFWLAITPVFGQALQPIWLFIGLERMDRVLQITMLSKSVFCALGFLLVRSPEDFYLIPVADGAGQLAAALFGFVQLYRAGFRISWSGWLHGWSAFKGTLSFFVSRLAVISYQNTGVLVLGALGRPADAGAFAIADQIYRAIQCAFAPVGLAVYPYMVAERDFRLYWRLFGGFAVASLLAAALVACGMPLIVSGVLGKEWSAVSPVVVVFMAGIVVTNLNVLSGYPLAAALDRVDVANRSVVAGALTYAVLLSAALVRGLVGPLALAGMVVLAELSVLAYRACALWPALRSRIAT